MHDTNACSSSAIDSDRLKPVGSKSREVLEHIQESVPAPQVGSGIRHNHFLPLAQFRSHHASLLVNQLEGHGIRCKLKRTRLRASIRIAFEDRRRGFEVLAAFKQQHSDHAPTGFRRDYDALFLCGLLAVIPAIGIALSPAPWVVLVAFLLSWGVVSIAVETLIRRCRQHGRVVLSLADYFLLTLAIAICAAAWAYLV